MYGGAITVGGQLAQREPGAAGDRRTAQRQVVHAEEPAHESGEILRTREEPDDGAGIAAAPGEIRVHERLVALGGEAKLDARQAETRPPAGPRVFFSGFVHFVGGVDRDARSGKIRSATGIEDAHHDVDGQIASERGGSRLGAQTAQSHTSTSGEMIDRTFEVGSEHPPALLHAVWDAEGFGDRSGVLDPSSANVELHAAWRRRAREVAGNTVDRRLNRLDVRPRRHDPTQTDPRASLEGRRPGG